MTSSLPTHWLRGVIATALGLNLAACAERSVEDLADEGANESESGETQTEMETETETGGTPTPDLPEEAQECRAGSGDFTVRLPPTPEGICIPCISSSCAEELVFDAFPDCQACQCTIDWVCSVEMPDESGDCIHEFDVDVWCDGGEGRPFLVDGETRVAPVAARSDWLCRVPELEVEASLRARVIAGWLDRAAMEHASVAAFARFTLQLLGLGAPAELVEAAQLASLDEARHARLCYAIASQIAGQEFGPGKLALAGIDLEIDPARVAWESIVEGCIGETIAAAKMRQLALEAESEPLAALLAGIAEDEATHAALAWRALSWMLQTFEIHDVVRSAFATALAQMEPGVRPSVEPVSRLGVLDEATSEWLTRAVLRDVIAPAAAALLDGPGIGLAA
jgi:hypothetical protein